MRDAAALMIMKFDNVTRISTLRDKSGTTTAPAEASSSEDNEDAEVQTTALEGTQDEAG